MSPPRAGAGVRVLIVNVNPQATTRSGVLALKRGLDGAARRLGWPADRLSLPIRHWPQLLDGGRTVQRLAPDALVLGPNGTPFPAYPKRFDTFLTWVRRLRRPTLGVCGGHQVMALAHGAPVGPVHAVPAARASYAGMPQVKGATAIRVLADPDPLLDGVQSAFGDELTVHASHVDEVKELPQGFRLLAIGDPSLVQIMRADRRPLWGVQFHPEVPVPPKGERSAGDAVLENWLRIAEGSLGTASR